MSGQQRLQVTEHGDVLILRFADKHLSADLAPEIGEEFRAAAARDGFLKTLLDFSGVNFACSDLIGTLVVFNKRVRGKGGRLKLCGICPYIREIFAVTKVDLILDIAASEAEALAAFG